jgi:hypothetical protein
VAIAPNHKKIAGIFCSSFFAVIYLLASISYGGVVWCQFIGSLIVIAIMTYRNEVIMREKIKYFLLVTAGIIFLIWCCRDIFFWKPEPKPLMSPKSINFDTNVPLKKYKNEIFSFLYPSNWKIEEYMEGQIEVLCKEEETDSTGFDTYIVVMTKTTVSANDILQANIAELKTDSFSYTVTLGDVFESQFNGRPSVCIDYESSFKDSFNGVFYNRLTVFKVGGYAVIMGKRAIEKSDLDTKFKIMEDSFSIDKKR